MRPAISVICIISLLLTASCAEKKNSLGPDAYIAHIENRDNGYKKDVTAGAFVYSIQYKPVEYVICKEMQESAIDSATFYKRVKELQNTVWFNIYIKPKNSNINPLKYETTGLDEYNFRLNYFLTKAGNNITLQYGGKDVLNSVAYHFENNFGLTPMDVMVVGFRIPDEYPVKDMTLSYEDKLFNNGIIKIRIDKKELLQVPSIQI